LRTKHPTEELTALIDGALPPGRAAKVVRHLEACAACRSERDRLALAVAALRRLPAPPEPSPLFATRLAARLAREGAPRRASRWTARLGAWAGLPSLRWKIAAPAAAAALAAGIAVFAIRLQRAEERAVAENLDLLLDYEAVASLGDVNGAGDVAVVAALDEIVPKKEATP
jgi:anti-sigma factor RsiW